MKSVWLAVIALIIPIAAAITMAQGLLGPRSDDWNLGNDLLVLLVGGPLTIASPFSSLAGVLCSVYALRHAVEKAGAIWLLVTNVVLLVASTVAAVGYVYMYKSPSITARRQHEQYLATRTPEQHLLDAALDPAEIAKLAAQGVDLNTRDSLGRTPLMLSIINAQYCSAFSSDAARQLLTLGADPDTRDFRGWTALHHACVAGREDVVELLIEHRANIAALTDNRETPLDLIAAEDKRGYSSQREGIRVRLTEAMKISNPTSPNKAMGSDL